MRFELKLWVVENHLEVETESNNNVDKVILVEAARMCQKLSVKTPRIQDQSLNQRKPKQHRL